MGGHLYGGTILGVVPWKFFLALALAIAGVLIIGCGVNVCWTRFSRRAPRRPPDGPGPK